MSKPLHLILNTVKCLREQAGEPGKDEMYLIAFGITGGGHRLYVPPTSLGSYGTGDNKTVNKTLLDESVHDGETLAALCFWLFERDSGDLATSGGAILSDFHVHVANYLALDATMGLPPDARHCYAFAQAEGIENPTDADLQRLDRGRPDKKVSNEHWESPSDPDARIARMKDGTTHLAYKAEHAVDLQTEAIVAATVTPADRGDGASGAETLIVAQWNLHQSGSEAAVTQLVADKGYHDNRLLTQCADWQVRTYIPERKQKSRVWTDKPAEYEVAFRGNRRRVRGEKGRRLNRWRSERCERTFAHVCETGGGRRSWLRGLGNVIKAHVLKCAAYNLGLLLRKVWGLGKPRSAAGLGALFFRLWTVWMKWLGRVARRGPIHHHLGPVESRFIPQLTPRRKSSVY